MDVLRCSFIKLKVIISITLLVMSCNSDLESQNSRDNKFSDFFVFSNKIRQKI